MDCSTLLQVQQQDFYHRLKLGNLLISQTSKFSGESYDLAPEIIQKINLNSVVKAQIIVENHLINISSEKLVELIFYRDLAQEYFLSQFNSLTISNSGEKKDHELDFTSCSFILKKNSTIKVLLKFYHGSLDELKLKISGEELSKYTIFVFSFFPHKQNQVEPKFQNIFLGFLPFNLLKKSKSDIELRVQDLLYIGGLNYYLKNNCFREQILSNLAKQFIKQGKYHQSIKIFNKIIKQKKKVDKYYFLRGICQYKLGNKKDALQDLHKVTTINQNYTSAYHWQGLIYQELGKYDQALIVYTQEIKIDSGNFFAYFQRALVHTKLNQFIDAIEDYTIALKISNQFFQAYYNRAYLYFHLRDKQNAVADYLKAIEIKPDLHQAHYNLAIIYQQLGNYQEAIKEYELTIRINPQYVRAYYNLAILLANIGFYDKAITYYQESLKFDPNFIQSIYNCESLTALLKNENHIVLNTVELFTSSIEKSHVMMLEDPNSTVIRNGDEQTTISIE